jgi:phage shock protein C
MNKLYRSRRDSKLTGLCGGLAEQLNVDSTLLRLVVVVTTFFSGGTVIPIYVIASIVVPKEPVMNIPPMYPPHTGMGGGQYRPQQAYYPNSGAAASHQSYPNVNINPQPAQPAAGSIDEMMKDVEKKAMRKEIEELRAKVAKYEKGE